MDGHSIETAPPRRHRAAVCLAKTTTANIASCRVLEKNGFLHTGTGEETFVMNGEVMTFTYYEWNHQ